MAFPKKKYWLWADGWERRGEMDLCIKIYCTCCNHTFCGHKLKIGIEKNEVFKYCPCCLVKV